MKRTIFNPALLLPLSCIFYFRTQLSYLFWMLTAATSFYVIGVVIVTMAGNVPLNNIIEGSSLETITSDDAKSLREGFENKWNSLNWIRTCCSPVSFLFLIVYRLLTKS